ncbi:TetR family transcriptional regulator [Lentzea sp. NBRC 105346]|uniref:TetR/AcrR family transcriptional regulator n=1 Tax=Lentzea sp. NBRC 105346 TaxID=3032205 RepID=UPI0025532D72|nr:TetR family transcriptional regulator [Lentzea sp. NBRC 105346]
MDQLATTPSAPEPSKGEQTRALILETALRLFKENGYDRTTMRAIAKEAGVSVGNAYYYFESKEHLVQGFYDRMIDLHTQASRSILADEPKFAIRLAGVLDAWLEVSQPYHEFAAQFFKNAADPASPLSPFSAESTPARDAGIGLMRSVLLGSTAKVDPELREDLPGLLWLYQMAIVLFWVHDKSEGASKTRMLAQRSAPMIARLVTLSATRVFRPITREAVQLFRDIGWFKAR